MCFPLKFFSTHFRIGFMKMDWVSGKDSCVSELMVPMP